MISKIENLSTTNDYYDGIDLSYNDISIIEGISILKNLKILILNFNNI